MVTTVERVLNALHQFNLKDEGNGNYRCNRPWSNGSDSKSLTVKIEGPEHGTFYDHVAGKGGSLYELAKRLNINTDGHRNSTKPSSENTPKAYADLPDYAQGHGVEPIVFINAGWGEDVVDNRLALRFPTANGDRLRFLDGAKPKFISPKGYKPCWYGLKRAVEMAKQSGKPLVLCNGEPSVVVAQSYGIPACAVTSGERSSYAQYLIDELKAEWDGDILITPDCDQTGKAMAEGLSKQLSREDFNVFSIDLNGCKGFDLADFCALHRGSAADDLNELDFTIAEAERLRFKVFTLADALKPQSPIDWIVDGLICPASLSLVVGDSGSKKTYSMLSMGICVAAGNEWLGKKTRACKVLFIDEESGERRMNRRLGEVARGELVKIPNTLPPVRYVTMAAIDLTDAKEAILLECVIKESGAELVVIDTLADIMPGADENAVKDVLPVFQRLRRITERLDIAIIVIHHTNKSGGYRGSTAMRGKVDLMLMVESKQDDPIIKFEVNKGRDVEGFKFTARAHWSETQMWLELVDTNEKVASFTKGEKYILAYLRDNGPAQIKTLQDNSEPYCAPTTARNSVYSLTDKKMVEKLDKEGKNVTVGLTDKGKEAALNV